MTTLAESSPNLIYSLIATKSDVLMEGICSSEKSIYTAKKYYRGSRKILKKINDGSLRRPDGMATLISGSYAYNYIHGYEYNNKKYHLLEHLIFLCVTPGISMNNMPNKTRELSFNYLTQIRRIFLTNFSVMLSEITKYSHLINYKTIIMDKNMYSNEESSLINNIQNKEVFNLKKNLYMFGKFMVNKMKYNVDNHNNDDDDIDNDCNKPKFKYIEYIKSIDIDTNTERLTDENTEILNELNPFSNTNVNNSESDYKFNENEEKTFIKINKDNSNNINNSDNESINSNKIKSNGSMYDFKDWVKTTLNFWRDNRDTNDNDEELNERMPLLKKNEIKFASMDIESNMDNEFTNNDKKPCYIKHMKRSGILISIIFVLYLFMTIFCSWNLSQCSKK